MNPLTINTTTFTLIQGATPVSGAVTYAGVTAMFTPLSGWRQMLSFTATITTGVQDLGGNALVTNYVWRFTTGAAPVGPVMLPPYVISTIPANTTENVPMGNRVVGNVQRSDEPANDQHPTFTLIQGAKPVSGTVTYAGVTAVFTPSVSLPPNALFTATITTTVQDLAGNSLASNYAWTFATGATPVGPIVVTPYVISTIPGTSNTNVPIGNALSARFSEAMNPLTISTGTFTLNQGAKPVSGTVTYVGVTATFTPSVSLAPNVLFTATITTGTQDLAGNPLATNYVWTFTTGASLPTVEVLGMVNAASYVAPVAAGSMASVFGNNLSIGPAPFIAAAPLPALLDQTSFAIGGQTAPLFFASVFQLNLQVPWELAGQTQTSIVATVNGVLSNADTVAIAPFAPGIFSVDGSGGGQGAILIAPTAELAAPTSAVPLGGYVSIFCTGLGPVTNQPATGMAGPSGPLSMTLTTPIVSIGGVGAEVTYSGLAPTLVGIYQVNAIVPSGVLPGNAVPVVIRMGNVASNTVTIAVQ